MDWGIPNNRRGAETNQIVKESLTNSSLRSIKNSTLKKWRIASFWILGNLFGWMFTVAFAEKTWAINSTIVAVKFELLVDLEQKMNLCSSVKVVSWILKFGSE